MSTPERRSTNSKSAALSVPLLDDPDAAMSFHDDGSSRTPLTGQQQPGSREHRATESASDYRKSQFVPQVRSLVSTYKKTVVVMVVGVIGILVAAAVVPRGSPVVTHEPHPHGDLVKWVKSAASCGDGFPQGIEANLTNLDPGGDPAVKSYTLHCERPEVGKDGWITILVTFAALVLMVADVPPDLVLLAASITLVLLGVVSSSEAWEGFSNGGVMTVAVLFVVAKGIESTGGMELVFRRVLGRPTSIPVAELRVMIPVAVFSAFLNNTPVVAILIPIIESWCESVELSPSLFMMPLSYASLLGGATTLIGTSANLIIKGLLEDRFPNESMSIFEMTPVAGSCAAIGILYLTFACPILLNKPVVQDPDSATALSGDGQDPGTTASSSASPARVGNLQDPDEDDVTDAARSAALLHASPDSFPPTYGSIGDASGDHYVEFSASRDRGASAASLRSFGSVADGASAPGSSSRRYRCLFEVQPKSPLAGSTLGTSGLLKIKNSSFIAIVRDGEVFAPQASLQLQEGDLVHVSGVASSLVRLRNVRGFAIRSPELGNLGPRRRHRRLFEVVLDRQSPLVGHSLGDSDSQGVYDAAIAAIRPWDQSVLSQIDHATLTDTPVPKSYVLRVGDALVVESFPRFEKTYATSSHFLLIHQVHESKPPRDETFMDKFRMVMSLCALVLMISLAAFDVAPLLELAMVAGGLFALAKILTVEEALSAIKFRVILAIVAAFGVGAAFEETGVAAVIAETLVDATLPMGRYAVMVAIGLVASFLGAIISNNATVILMFPICVQVAALLPDVSVKQLVIVLMVVGSSSFLTPISYQTNLMVWQPGGYSFVDFPRIGVPLQLIMVFASAFFSLVLVPSSSGIEDRHGG